MILGNIKTWTVTLRIPIMMEVLHHPMDAERGLCVHNPVAMIFTHTYTLGRGSIETVLDFN